MTLRRLTITMAIFLALAAVLTLLWARHARRQVGPRLAPIVVTLPEVPADNGYDLFLSATELYADTGVDLGTKPGVPITADQQKALEDNAAALAEMRRGLEKDCVVPIKPIDTLASLDSKSTFRTFARLLLIESRLHSDDGRFGDAALPLADGLRFGAKLQVGAPLIDRLVGQAIQMIMIAEYRRLAASGHLTEADLVSALQLLAEIEAMAPPIGQTLEVECRMAGAAVGSLPSGPAARLAGLTPPQVEEAMRRQRDPMIRLSRKSYRDVKAAADSPPRRPSLLPRRAVAEMMNPVWTSSIAKDFERRSERRGTQLFFAVELYRIRHGQPPPSLTDLESLDLPGVELSTTDPLTDKPYIYRVDDGDYSLHSAGPSLTDDGGTERVYGTQRPHDLVFHTPLE